MEKPTIRFYIERKPAHYVGDDISITLKCKNHLSIEEINLVKDLLQSGLINCDYEFEDNE
jgi:hypothetical protein